MTDEPKDKNDDGDWLDSIGGPETGAFPKPGESKKVTAEDPNRYTMRGEVGRGGIGRVLVGFDEHIGRDVAIKELLPERGGSGSARSGSGSTAFVDRFLREARVTGQLEHPHIVPVYELGRHADGTLYYVMKMVRGQTLAAALADSESLEERLGFLGHFANACQAIAYAHSRGVIHRDLKPENIMVDEFGETVVLDWGLAKVRGKEDLRQSQIEREIELLTDSQGGTVDGSAIGTPSYMAPEQADGNVEEIDERSDVWGLGAVLYELLTGRPPFIGETAYEIIGQVVSAPLVPVCDVEPAAPRELAAVAEKALQRDKDDRYLSATELTGEIEAFRSGRRVEAHSYSAWELVRRLVTHNRAATAVAGIGLAVLAVFFSAAYIHILDERDHAVAAREEAQHHLAQALAEKARSAARDHDWAGATVFAAAALERAELPDVRGILMAVAPAWQPELLWQKRSGNICAAVVMSPDGTRVACPTLLGMPFWEVGSGNELARINTSSGWLTAAAYSPDGTMMAAPSHDKSVHVWRLGKDGAPELEQHGSGHTAIARAVAFSPDGSLIASAGEDKSVRIWRLPEPLVNDGALEPVHTLSGPRDTLTAVVFSPDGNSVIAADKGGYTRVWETSTGKLLHTFVHEVALRDLQVSPDGTRLAGAREDGLISVWRLAAAESSGARASERRQRQGGPGRTLQGHEGPVLVVRFGADGETLYSGGSDGTVRVWSVRTHASLGRLHAHTGEVHSLVVSENGSALVTTGEDKTVRSWRAAPPTPTSLAGSAAAVHSVTHSPDGEVLVVGTGDQNIRIWDLQVGRLVVTLPAHDDLVAAVAFHPTEQSFLSGGHDGVLYAWKVTVTERGPLWLRSRIAKLDGRIRTLALSPDGSVVVVAGDDRLVHLWDLSNDGTTELRGHGDIVTSLSFSADGTRLLSGSWDRSVRLWDVAKREQVGVLQGHEESVLGVVFTADGKRVLSASADQSVRLWDLEAGVHIRLLGHRGVVHAVGCARRGPWCATAGEDGTVRVWDVDAGLARAVVDTDGQPLTLAFRAHDTGLTVGTASGAIHLLELAPLTLARDGMLAEVEARYGLSLSGMRVAPKPF